MPEAPLSDREVHALLFNPFDESFRGDPYAAYRRLRQERPLFWHPVGFWVATGYADCNVILRDRRFRPIDPQAWQGEGRDPQLTADAQTVRGVLGQAMLWASSRDHQRQRGPLNAAFAPAQIEARRPRLRQIAHDLIDAFPTGAAFDFVQHFATLYPARVLAELMGIPDEGRERFGAWGASLNPILDPVQPPSALRAVSTTIAQFTGYLEHVLDGRAPGPSQDLLSVMAARSPDGSVLTRQELVANVGFVLGAGQISTAHFLANGAFHLLSRPDVWAGVREGRHDVGRVVEEILRFESPVQMTAREATENVPMGGRLVQQGRRVVAIIGSANRDPAAFSDPDRFDPDRTPNEHLAFSAGSRFCLGAPLVRAEGQECFRALSERLPDLRLAEPKPTWQETVTMRGPSRLMVRC